MFSILRWLNQRSDKRFAKDIERKLATFLQSHAAIFESPQRWRYDSNPWNFTAAEATVVTSEARLQFTKWRNELSITAASLRNPYRWEGIHSLLRRSDGQTLNSGGPLIDQSLSELNDVLERNWNQIVSAVNEGNQ